jgi:hypothetical protein
VLRSLVAFANTSGGAVLIGVEDRTRHVRGIKEPLDLEERLANLISDQAAQFVDQLTVGATIGGPHPDVDAPVQHDGRLPRCRSSAGLAPPTVEEIGNRFRVTLWLEQVGDQALDKTEQAIL